MEKKKNKRLMARIVSLMGVVLLFACMVLPASAASGSTPYWYSVLPIDHVRLIQSSESVVDVPFAPDYFLSNTDDLTVGDGSVGYGVSSILPKFDERYVTYDIQFNSLLSSFNSVVLYSEQCFIYTADLRSKNFSVACGYDGDQGCRLDISFSVRRIVATGDEYQTRVTTLSSGYHLSPDQNILGLISSMLTDGNFVPSDVVYLENLTLTFSQFENDDNWMQFNTDVRRTRADASAWVDQYNLLITTENVYQVVEGGFSFDWLVSSVDAFLNVQIFPNFTIGGLLRVVVIIGLMFLFMKMTI